MNSSATEHTPAPSAPAERWAIIFDVDGLMKNTEAPWRRAIQDSFAEHGYWLDQETLFDTHGKSVRTLNEMVEASLGAAGAVVDIKVIRERIRRAEQIIWERFKEEPPPDMEGLRELIEYLEQNEEQFGRAIGSSAERWWAELVLGDVKDHFEVMITWDEAHVGKPNPLIFKMAAEALGIPEERCIVLDDAEAGVAAAEKAGMLVIQIPDPPGQTVESRGPFHLVRRSLREAKEYLRQRFSGSSAEFVGN
jgi:HAD superfamily hydrolase (TIGR01509 family)